MFSGASWLPRLSGWHSSPSPLVFTHHVRSVIGCSPFFPCASVNMHVFCCGCHPYVCCLDFKTTLSVSHKPAHFLSVLRRSLFRSGHVTLLMHFDTCLHSQMMTEQWLLVTKPLAVSATPYPSLLSMWQVLISSDFTCVGSRTRVHRDQRLTLAIFSSIIHLIFDRVSHLNWSTSPRYPPLSASLALKLQAWIALPSFSCDLTQVCMLVWQAFANWVISLTHLFFSSSASISSEFYGSVQSTVSVVYLCFLIRFASYFGKLPRPCMW